MISKGKIAAKKIMSESGIENTVSFPLKDMVRGYGATIIEKPLQNAEGRIVFGSEKRAIITINSDIMFESKKRFVLAHEFGHFIMHRNYFVNHNDDELTLNSYKKGEQETEANEFASEILMPEGLFQKSIKNKKFSFKLIKELSEEFQTSLTASIFRFIDLGNTPIAVVYSEKGIVKYFRKSNEFYHKVKDLIKLQVPEYSVAKEYLDDNKIYDKEQDIKKSDWLELKNYEEDSDFYEFCVITKPFNSILSVIWEK
jgi:Zn-dependent peptidase ImmA (M78 family)